MLTFQPRWVFDRILGTPKAAEHAFAKVRTRRTPFDMLPPSPDLGHYGHPLTREYRQYFLDDENGTTACPFRQLGERPGKEHAWHHHQTDETLVVLSGNLRLYWEDGEQVCGAGDVIELPAWPPRPCCAWDRGHRSGCSPCSNWRWWQASACCKAAP